MPEDGILILNTLRFEQEILPQPKVEGTKTTPRTAVNGKELQTALRLIDEMSAPWQPKEYRDTYRDDLMKRIRQKVKAGESKTLTAPEKGAEREERGKVVDLMALLQKSLAEKRRGPRRASPRRGTPQPVAPDVSCVLPSCLDVRIRPSFGGRTHQVDELRCVCVLGGRSRPVSRDDDPTHGASGVGRMNEHQSEGKEADRALHGVIVPPSGGSVLCATSAVRVR